MKHHMTCCCCGAYAGYCEQWWNRDTGYSICTRCVEDQRLTATSDEIRQLYGQQGVNYASESRAVPVPSHQGEA